MPWIWGTLTLETDRRYSGPYHLVWPRDLYHVATAQKVGRRRRRPRGALLDYLWRVAEARRLVLAEHVRRRHAAVDEPAARRGRRCRSCSPGGSAGAAPTTGRTSSAAADYVVANGPRTPQERWENQDGYSPNTIAAEIAGLICAADIARANGDAGSAATYEATADDWQQSVERWTATTNGPLLAEAVLPAHDQGRRTRTTARRTTLGRQLPVGRSTSARSSTTSFLGLVLFGVKRFDDPTVAQLARRSATSVLGVDTPNGRFWHRFTFDGYGEHARRRRLGHVPDAGHDQTLGRAVAAAGRRARRVRAARRAATPRRGCATIAAPPTTG